MPKSALGRPDSSHPGLVEQDAILLEQYLVRCCELKDSSRSAAVTTTTATPNAVQDCNSVIIITSVPISAIAAGPLEEVSTTTAAATTTTSTSISTIVSPDDVSANTTAIATSTPKSLPGCNTAHNRSTDGPNSPEHDRYTITTQSSARKDRERRTGRDAADASLDTCGSAS
jgi:hypothetical protein